MSVAPVGKIVGQDRALALLRGDLKSGRIAHSYLFTGPNGVGKLSAALEFSQAINCRVAAADFAEARSRDGCACSSCRKIESRTHPDVFVLNFTSQAELLDLEPDQRLKQKDYRIDSVRVLINRSFVTPVEARKKIFIVDGAELLNRESANALLKVLEEPADLSHWILTATSSERVFGTVRSRCRRISFAPLDVRDIERILEMSRPVAEICEGSVALAQVLMQPESLELGRIADEVLSQPDQANPIVISARIFGERKSGRSKNRAEEFLKIVMLKMAQKLRAEPNGLRAEKLIRALESQEEIRRNASPQLVLESLLFSLRKK